MEEIWKDIEGFPDYQVSNLGRVKSFKCGKEKILNGSKQKGYMFVVLSENKMVKHKPVHRLVAIAFLGKNSMLVNHKDGNKLNNLLSNLEYVSNRENISHGFLSKKTSSKYVGVSFYKKTKRWQANIQIKGKQNKIGYFKTELEAHEAYKKALEENNIKSKYI
jgi:hypothetical protein